MVEQSLAEVPLWVSLPPALQGALLLHLHPSDGPKKVAGTLEPLCRPAQGVGEPGAGVAIVLHPLPRHHRPPHMRTQQALVCSLAPSGRLCPFITQNVPPDTLEDVSGILITLPDVATARTGEPGAPAAPQEGHEVVGVVPQAVQLLP